MRPWHTPTDSDTWGKDSLYVVVEVRGREAGWYLWITCMVGWFLYLSWRTPNKSSKKFNHVSHRSFYYLKANFWMFWNILTTWHQKLSRHNTTGMRFVKHWLWLNVPTEGTLTESYWNTPPLNFDRSQPNIGTEYVLFGFKTGLMFFERFVFTFSNFCVQLLTTSQNVSISHRSMVFFPMKSWTCRKSFKTQQVDIFQTFSSAKHNLSKL